MQDSPHACRGSIFSSFTSGLRFSPTIRGRLGP